MRENLPVVIRVLDAFFKIDKESAGVANAADHKPDRRNKSDDGRNDQRCNEELDRPPFIRPGADCIPNDDCQCAELQLSRFYSAPNPPIENQHLQAVSNL